MWGDHLMMGLPMITKNILLPVLFSTLSLAGCSNSAPECSDIGTVSLVTKIAGDELVKQKGQSLRNELLLQLSAIRTTEIKESTGARSCAAQLDMTKIQVDMDNAKIVHLPITYTVELADNGNEFFVNVFGL